MTDTVIAVDNLTYFYPGKKALDDVSFAIPRGSITALVGPNGAGKSTLLRALAGLDLPFAGRIAIAGVNVLEHPRLAHSRIGFLSDDFGLYNDLAVRDVLDFIAGCHDLTEAARNSRIDEVAAILRLQGVMTQKAGTLSRGWRQRVGIALAILHKPDVLILDEPASGLDPEARSELSAILKNLCAGGMTILVSSHILAELEEYCTAMLVLRDGRIQQHVTMDSRPQQATQTVRVTLAVPLTAEQEAAIPGIAVEPGRMAFCLSVAGNEQARHALLKDLIARGLPVCGFGVDEATMQALYLETARAGGHA